MNLNSNIFVTGGRGMLGRALIDVLVRSGFKNIFAPSSKELNLINSDDVKKYVASVKPDCIFHLASLVYGLKGNMNNQFESLVNNTKIYASVLEAVSARGNNCKIFFAGTVASYGFPYVKQPIVEDDLFVGLPHGGEYGYSMAKRHAYNYLKILKDTRNIDFVYGLLTNLFGEFDTFDPENGHVIPSLISKAVKARSDASGEFEVWGNPSSTRDFLYVKDAANAIVYLMDNGSGIYNISSGIGRTMEDLASSISKSLDEEVKPVWNVDEPVGISSRHVSNERLALLGFNEYTPFDVAINNTVSWYLEN